MLCRSNAIKSFVLFTCRINNIGSIIPTTEEEELFNFASNTATLNNIKGIRVAGGWVRNNVRKYILYIKKPPNLLIL